MISKAQSGLDIRPWMVGALVFLWVWTAFVSLGPGHAWGMSLMNEIGASTEHAKLAILGGAVSDAILGFGLLIGRWRRHVLKAQLALMVCYTLIITVMLPHYWFDPYASVAKNVVLMVATLWLIRTEPQQ